MSNQAAEEPREVLVDPRSGETIHVLDANALIRAYRDATDEARAVYAWRDTVKAALLSLCGDEPFYDRATGAKCRVDGVSLTADTAKELALAGFRDLVSISESPSYRLLLTEWKKIRNLDAESAARVAEIIAHSTRSLDVEAP